MGFAKSAGWMICGLVLAANGAQAQEAGQESPLPVKSESQHESREPGDIDASDKPLREAEALMQSGKPDEAYKLLEPLEFDRSGEVRFDYLIGIAALDSGKPDRATLAFERVMAVDPDYAGARLDMARAYFQLGDLQRAKTEFETVLKQNPSTAARATIQNYLDRIAEAKDGKRTRITAYVEGAVGRDTNVNNASELPNNMVTPTLNPASVELPDNYFGTAAGGEIRHTLNAHWGLYAGADFNQRNNLGQKSFDTLNLDGRAGVIYGTGADRIRVGVSGGQHSLGGARDRNTGDINAEWRHAVGSSNQLNVFGQYVQYRYVAPAMQVNDINQLATGLGWLHVLGDAKSTLTGSVYLGSENDVGPVTPSNPNGGRADGVKRFGGLRIGGQAALGGTTKLFFGTGIQDGSFASRRTDRLTDWTVGAIWYLDNLWTMRAQLTRFNNISSAAAYSYDRSDISLAFRRNFN